MFADQGCELLDDQYINNHTPMSFKCSCGIIGKRDLANFKKGSSSDNMRNNAKYNRQEFEKWLDTKTHNIKAIMKGEFGLLFN